MKATLPQPEILAALRRKLACREDRPRARFSSGLDRILPRGFPRGGLVEYFARGGSGATALALVAAREACREGQSLVVVDRQRQFHPLAAEHFAAHENMLLVHPTTQKDEIWAIHQSLRCRGVGAVVCWPRKLPDRVFRSLQLAAEHGGAVGLFIRSIDADGQQSRSHESRSHESRGQPSWADIQLLVEAVPSGEPLRRLKVQLLRCRMSGAATSTKATSMELELNDETGMLQESRAVHLAAKLAHSAALRRASRA